MRIGDEYETGVWYDANEWINPIAQCGKDLEDAIRHLCSNYRVRCGDIEFEVMKPGDSRVPEVPRWLESKTGVVPRLLVARTTIVGSVVNYSTGILADLDKKDLIKLRAITKRAHKVHFPKTPELSDEECDSIIDQLGMEVALESLRKGTIH